MTVWVIEHGDYEQRSVWAVVDSVETAVRQIMERYDSRYVVQWDTHTKNTPIHGFPDHEEWTLVGHFEQVPDISTKHSAYFSITKYVVNVWGF